MSSIMEGTQLGTQLVATLDFHFDVVPDSPRSIGGFCSSVVVAWSIGCQGSLEAKWPMIRENARVRWPRKASLFICSQTPNPFLERRSIEADLQRIILVFSRRIWSASVS
jgi:hypothetical protein